MPAATQAPAGPQKEVKKLVLCFDGTGNSFQGNTGDTNIVKIYDKLDRDDDNQYHYYQRKLYAPPLLTLSCKRD